MKMVQLLNGFNPMDYDPTQGGGGSAPPADLGSVIDPALPRVPPPE